MANFSLSDVSADPSASCSAVTRVSSARRKSLGCFSAFVPPEWRFASTRLSPPMPFVCCCPPGRTCGSLIPLTFLLLLLLRPISPPSPRFLLQVFVPAAQLVICMDAPLPPEICMKTLSNYSRLETVRASRLVDRGGVRSSALRPRRRGRSELLSGGDSSAPGRSRTACGAVNATWLGRESQRITSGVSGRASRFLKLLDQQFLSGSDSCSSCSVGRRHVQTHMSPVSVFQFIFPSFS